MTETNSDKEAQYWIGYERCKAKEPKPVAFKGVAFIKGSPYFEVKRESLKILEIA